MQNDNATVFYPNRKPNKEAKNKLLQFLSKQNG